MQTPPGSAPQPLPPTDPHADVSVRNDDTTVVDVGQPTPPPDGRAPGPPWPLIALIAAMVLIGVIWFGWAQMQQQATVTAEATATAVAQATVAAAQATATAESASASQQAAAVTQTVVQATTVAQAAAATGAQAAAQASAAQATAAAASTPEATPPPATPVVVVVTATPAPPPPPTIPSAPAAPPAPPAPAAAPKAPPAPAIAAAPPSAPKPEASATQPAERTDAPAPAPDSPTRAPIGASPAASPAAPRPAVTANSVTTTDGQPVLLQCLGERVRLSADAGVWPPQTTIHCRPDAAANVPPPPGPVVNDIIFQLAVDPTDGTAMPESLDLQVTYSLDAVPAAERGTLVVGFFDGQVWSPLPDQTATPASGRITATVSEVGSYALYRRP